MCKIRRERLLLRAGLFVFAFVHLHASFPFHLCPSSPCTYLHARVTSAFFFQLVFPFAQNTPFHFQISNPLPCRWMSEPPPTLLTLLPGAPLSVTPVKQSVSGPSQHSSLTREIRLLPTEGGQIDGRSALLPSARLCHRSTHSRGSPR